MAGETNPKPFCEVCPTIDPPVDREVAPAVAHARPVAFPSATQHNPSSAASASGSTDQHKGSGEDVEHDKNSTENKKRGRLPKTKDQK